MSDEWDDIDGETNVGQPPPLEGLSRKRARLIVLAGGNVGEIYTLDSLNVSIGRADEADIRVADEGISRRHCKLRIVGGAAILEDDGSRNGTFLNGEAITRSPLTDGDRIQIGRSTIFKFTYQDELEHRVHAQLIESAVRDAQTGAYNKRYFLDRIESEFQFAARHGTKLSLLMLDLDHFKKINDTYGHLAGDRGLTVFSAHILAAIRTEDVFARYGGEEFAVILRATSLTNAELTAERLRYATENLRISHDGVDFKITVSIGVAGFPDNPIRDAVGMVESADRALYEAKREGRNRVSVCSNEPPEVETVTIKALDDDGRELD